MPSSLALRGSILITGTGKYATLFGERDFDVIKLRIYKWGNQPGLARWAHCNHKLVTSKSSLSVLTSESVDFIRSWKVFIFFCLWEHYFLKLNSRLVMYERILETKVNDLYVQKLFISPFIRWLNWA